MILIKSILLGFLISLPLGPIGILCLRRFFLFGPLVGFISAFGEAFACMIFGVIVTFSLELIADFITANQFWLRLIGGLVLIVIGSKIFFSKRSESSNTMITQKGLAAHFFSLFFLTLTSPQTFLGVLAIFAGLGLSDVNTIFEGIGLITGILIGSISFWMLVCLFMAQFKKTSKALYWINFSTGIFLVAFGFAAFFGAIALKF